MPDYRLSAEARRDLKDIARYIANDDLQAAHRMMERLHEAMQHLCDLPAMGRERPELSDAPLRSWRVGKYLILYLAQSPVMVVRIVSGYRHLPDLFA